MDVRLRDAQRRAATGSLHDQAALLRERVRAGTLPVEDLHLAAYVLDPAARLAVLGRTEEELRYAQPEDARRGPLSDVRESPLATHAMWAMRLAAHVSSDGVGLAPHPTPPYVAALAAVAVTRHVQALVVADTNRSRPETAPMRRDAGQSGMALVAAEAWLACPCPGCRSRLSETVDSWGEHAPEMWWRGTVAMLCGWGPADRLLAKIMGNGAALTIDRTRARGPVMTPPVRLKPREVEDAARAIQRVVRDALAPWLLRENRAVLHVGGP